ncbi:adenylyltransferase and sulfurtransferase MOCS3 isoform X2 [Latimeria chalumnae]|uniref:adenylyltransferase and sulfurtransferase MOCS3 isoform X2 n=1 Tax=Latimeria chalumnae TaxID=7897 RepID=UPI0003C14675|nr:PREDICTED: adenylyltransferase and sulfurtransferase MOCS3 [Latimeria chalumnae]|eukprot:XP_005994008.1 PREDICTED: adenylyltransferase and sulfurtransferase MOCS3 [Latimeria chalumnae]
MEALAKIKARLARKEKEVEELTARLAQLEKGSSGNQTVSDLHTKVTRLPPLEAKTSLTNEDILRYSRQLIVMELGVKGRLGLLDYDEVEISNLHRQILHAEVRRGMSKSLSAATVLHQLNSSVEYIPYHLQLNRENALDLIQLYDIIADCSDNVPTRYLVNDACVLSGKPLVSASALRMEGQLTVYNYNGGPCYRCLYPKPPPPETVTNCADGGVLGIVPGIMGSLQALEVLKIASGIGSSYSQQMLMFDAVESRFRTIKLRPKQADCAVCGENPTVKELLDYEAFCGSAATDKCRTLHLLTSEQRISVTEYKRILDNQVPHVLVDVRSQMEVDICHLPHSVNIPLIKLEEKNVDCIKLVLELVDEIKRSDKELASVYVICKLGNDSQKAVKVLREMSGNELPHLLVKDIQGGLMAWAHKIDATFPQY